MSPVDEGATVGRQDQRRPLALQQPHLGREGQDEPDGRGRVTALQPEPGPGPGSPSQDRRSKRANRQKASAPPASDRPGGDASTGCGETSRRRRGLLLRQCGPELRGRLEPVGRELGQRRQDRLLEGRRNRLAQQTRRSRLLGEHPRDDRLDGRARERRLPGEHLVEDAAQRVDVGPGVSLALPRGLLGTHVARRPKADTRGRQPVRAASAGGQGDPEIGHQRLTLVEEDVLGLDVAVDHAVTVGVVERGGHLDADPDGSLDGQLLLPHEPVTQRLALEIGGDVEDRAVHRPRVEEGHDVRMLQVGGGGDLVQEPVGADGSGELGPHDLDGDVAIVPEIVGQIDRGHAARAELPLDPVATCQGRLQAS